MKLSLIKEKLLVGEVLEKLLDQLENWAGIKTRVVKAQNLGSERFKLLSKENFGLHYSKPYLRARVLVVLKILKK